MLARCAHVRLILVFALLPLGCDRGKSGGSGDSASSSDSTLSAADREAVTAVSAEVGRHWTKSADGFVSAYNSGNAFAPNYLRQLREIAVAGVEPRELDESDKMNGVQWAGQINFKKVPSREAGDPSPVMADFGNGAMRAKGRWSQWVDVTPEPVHAQKVKGQWQFRQQTMLLLGTQPTPVDYRSAGVSAP